MTERTERIVIDEPAEGKWLDIDDLPVRLRTSNEYVVLADHWVPSVFELEVRNPGEAAIYARVDVDESGQRLTELRFFVEDPESRGIIQQDLRDVEVRAILEDFLAGFVVHVDRDAKTVTAGLPDSAEYDAAVRMMSRLRVRTIGRDITDELLHEVARVYRENIAGHPGKAVEHYFQVKQRTAAEYVSRARKRGYLPPTKRGKKQA